MATKEDISLRYMLRSLYCKTPSDKSCPTKIFNDNYSVVKNAQNPAADFSKKNMAISYYIVKEAVAAEILETYWVGGGFNMSDILPKQTPKPEIKGQCDHIFW